MPKLYASLALILLLGAAFWYVYNLGENNGIYTERAKWQDERLALISERDKLRETAEREIVKDRVVYRDRIQKIREVTTNNCELPPDLISLLRESGIFRH